MTALTYDLERRPLPDEGVDPTVTEPGVEPWTPTEADPTQQPSPDTEPHHDPKPGEQTDPDETGPGTQKLHAVAP